MASAIPFSGDQIVTNADFELPYDINFAPDVQPYTISVHEDLLDLTSTKLGLTRFVKNAFEDLGSNGAARLPIQCSERPQQFLGRTSATCLASFD